MPSQSSILLVQDSFSRAVSANDNLVRDFYIRLFEVAPHLRSMFPDQLDEQSTKLAKTLAFALHGLDNIGALVDPLQRLGAQHATLGVEPEHYPIVAAVLIETLASVLGADWSDEHAMAWDEILTTVAETMIAGAENSVTDAA